MLRNGRSLLILVAVLLLSLTAYYWPGRLRPHTKLVFNLPRHCVLYVPNSVPKDFLIVGNNLNHETEDRGRVHTIVFSGTGAVKYGKVQIGVGTDRILIDDRVLDGAWCSYVLNDAGAFKPGEIRTAD